LSGLRQTGRVTTVGVAPVRGQLLRLLALLLAGVLVGAGRGLCLLCQRCAYLVPFSLLPDPAAARLAIGAPAAPRG